MKNIAEGQRGVILASKSAQKLREEEKPVKEEKKHAETETVLSKINELITLAVEKGRGPSAVTGHRYSEYLKGLERTGEAERRRKGKEPEEPQIPAVVKKETPAMKTAVVPIPITEEALKATYSLAAALDKAKSGKRLEWLA